MSIPSKEKRRDIPSFVYTGRVEEQGLDRGRIVLSRVQAKGQLYCSVCHRNSFHVVLAWKDPIDGSLKVTARCIGCNEEETKPAPPGVTEADMLG